MTEKPEIKTNETEQSGTGQARRHRTAKVIKSVLLGLLFAAILSAAAFRLTDVLRQKWGPDKHSAQLVVQGYYEEPEDSLDVLILGASGLRNGLSPLEMYHEFGFTSYSRATSHQFTFVSYQLLLETLERQHGLKALVLDVSPLSNNLFSGLTEEDLRGRIHEAVDYMPWSKYKREIIRQAMQADPSASLTDYLVPLYTYHDRWEEIEKQDYTYREWQPAYCYKGQNPSLNIISGYTFDKNYMQDQNRSDGSFAIDPDSAEWVKQMIGVCREHGILPVLVKTPSGTWSRYRSEVIGAFAEENGVAYLDFNLPEIQERIGFDSKQDFNDYGAHLNVLGARKISRFVGQYLSENAGFAADRRSDPAFASWDAAYGTYAVLTDDIELQKQTNLISYLDMLREPDYIVMIATKFDTSAHYNAEIAEAFGALGIETDFGAHEYLSYTAVLWNNAVVSEKPDPDPDDGSELVTDAVDVAGHRISLSSYCANSGNNASILFDGEEVCPNGNGFNFAVYDTRAGQIVSQKSFHTGLRGNEYHRPDPFAAAGKDPEACLDLLQNDDYISVIGVCGDGMKFIPKAVNEKLQEMGLLPLDGKFYRPYLAILDGGTVVYNEYGDVYGRLAKECPVGEVGVTAISNTAQDAPNCYIKVGDAEYKTGNNGFVVFVYSKSQRQSAASVRYQWNSRNYITERDFNAITDLTELLAAAQSDGEDLYFVYTPGLTPDGLSETTVETLRAHGCTELTKDRAFAAAILPDGTVRQLAGDGDVSLQLERNGMEIVIAGTPKRSGVTVGGVKYSTTRSGLYVLICHAQKESVIGVKYFD